MVTRQKALGILELQGNQVIPNATAQEVTQVVTDTSFADFLALNFEQRLEIVARHTVQEDAADAVEELADTFNETAARTTPVRETG